jgi:hypothetical protein
MGKNPRYSCIINWQARNKTLALIQTNKTWDATYPWAKILSPLGKNKGLDLLSD